MNREQITGHFEDICTLVFSKDMNKALEKLYMLAVRSQNADFIIEVEKYREIYRNIVKFTIQGVKDSNRQKIYDNLTLKTIELAELIREALIANDPVNHIYRLKNQLQNEARLTPEESEKLVEDLTFNIELGELLKSSNVGSTEETMAHQRAIDWLFNKAWLTDKYTDSETELIKKIGFHKGFPWFEKSLLISAISLSLWRCFDTKKFLLLISFCEDNHIQLSIRALIGILIALYIHQKRMYLYPELEAEITKITKTRFFKERIENIVIQFIKAKETEKVSRKFREEVMPDVIKLAPKLADKLDLENLLNDQEKNEDEDKNPYWENLLKDNPELYDKLEQYSRKQLEGTDVFISTFAMLKRFDFFSRTANWLLPFYPENEAVRSLFYAPESNINSEELLQAVSASYFLCNSDKYSFFLNLKSIPTEQQNMMAELFISEIEGLKEMSMESENLAEGSNDRYIITQYIQDLYRFLKLYPYRNELPDLFALPLDFHRMKGAGIIFRDKASLKNIADFYFEMDYFSDAFDIFFQLTSESQPSAELFQKMAYCKQMSDDFSSALEWYKKADLFDHNKAWNLKKMALCSRKLKDYKSALNYLQEAETLEPENLYIQVNIGHCYLDLKDYEKALKYYYKVEYLKPDNIKVLRPLAWCNLALGKIKEAVNILGKIPETELRYFDIINIGHAAWCGGNIQEAAQLYRKSLDFAGNSPDILCNIIKDDSEMLFKNGVSPDDLPFMLDYLRQID